MRYPQHWSYDVTKKNIILCIWCNAMSTWFVVQKTHYYGALHDMKEKISKIVHTIYLFVPSF